VTLSIREKNTFSRGRTGLQRLITRSDAAARRYRLGGRRNRHAALTRQHMKSYDEVPFE